jgi:hydantoinase/carbamoylase family amidase
LSQDNDTTSATGSSAHRADPARLEETILALADFGRVGPTAVTRLAFTEEDEAAHAFILERMAELGLRTRIDAFGNVFGRREGTDPDAPVVLTGSHLDGPPDGGMFDGTVGVVCALEGVRLLNERGVQTVHPIEVAAIRCEHLDRFGLSCLGSRAMAGKLVDEDLDQLRDVQDGQTLRDALGTAGHLRGPLASVRRGHDLKAFVELHIEQGRVLEDRGERLGVVTSIPGPTRFQVRLRGSADHSGGTPMALRRDALCGAADVVLALERGAQATATSVGTVGILTARPGAVHTIPGEVELFVDIRGVDIAEKDRLVASFQDEMRAIASRRGLKLESHCSVDELPVPCSPAVRTAIASALDNARLEFIEMASGGGHDAQHMAKITDAGMIFVPSIAGISHTPEERTAWEDLALGTEALAASVERLATQRGPL